MVPKIRFSHHEKVALPVEGFLALIYLVGPVVLFFLLYAVSWVAVPVASVLVWRLSRIEVVNHSELDRWQIGYFVALAAATVFASGAVGPLYTNGDWFKHYAILNALAEHATLNIGDDTLRYYIGAYVAPSLIERFVGFTSGMSISIWLIIGLSIFFIQVSSLMGSKLWKLLAPVVFIFFSGMDIVGYWITGFERGNIHHLEWWAGWIEYSSSLTSIFWAPQNTIPAWMAAAFFLSRPNVKQFVAVAPLLLMACVLWSPFVALGVSILMLHKINSRVLNDVMRDGTGVTLVALTAGLLSYYVTFDSVAIPRSFVWNNPCLKSAVGEPCFTSLGYVEFVVLEVLCIAAVAFSVKETRTWLGGVACLLLVLLPFVQVGLYNDIAMSASRPALAVLALYFIMAVQSQGALRKYLGAVVFILGVVTPASELYRAFELDQVVARTYSLESFLATFPDFAQQYVTAKKIWFIREDN